ncbi:Aste57867_19714 [Aphanomyces stellatus]|uniref:Aste57867_19714 protein n=1 Tax=Aphanomyces stellatus TaxID=120398 RepID=A0A485LD87_9STRA|nr:hypothetical protein As57867_019649 [Aphanomyces stellatus]VFT96413.1 Aste57867_19714 [Aphanomyces stellatus]
MGCAPSSNTHVSQPSAIHSMRRTKSYVKPRTPRPISTSHASSSTPSAVDVIAWSKYPDLEPFAHDYLVPAADLRVIRSIPSNYMKTELGALNGETVLIKSMDSESAADELAQSRKALVSEITSMVRIDHPNIVGFKGFSITPEKGLVCISEYMEGNTLRSVLDNPKQFAKLTWTHDKIKFAIDIGSALAYMHSLTPRLIHRNVKASKVLLNSRRSQAKLSGFGSSRDRSFEQEMTNKIGDIEWSAPELIMDDEDYTEKVDVYSFGVLLTELDTGLMPLAEAKASMASAAFTNKLVSGALRPQHSPECPDVIVKIIKSCLQQDPHIRPSSDRVLAMLRQAQETLQALPVE